MFLFFAFSVIFVLCDAQVPAFGPCPKYPTKPNFEAEKVILNSYFEEVLNSLINICFKDCSYF